MRAFLLVLLLAGGMAQGAPPAAGQPQDAAELLQGGPAAAEREFASLGRALLSLPLAAILAAVLAFRPRQRHAPPRSPEVVQTQIMLALVGAMVMLVVGASLARAFGIAGAASLVRYRAKVSDPKDASVMLSALGIGLACGVGLFYLAALATAFIVGVLWFLEWLEPRPTVVFNLGLKRDDAAALKPRVEAVLRRQRLRHELRSSAPAELCYEVEVPVGRSVERVSEAILRAEPASPPAIQWKEKEKS